MIQTILGQKAEQTQRFLEDGRRIPVTVVAVPDNPVVAVKTQEKNAYTAVQIGIGNRKKSTKALMGHVKKANLTAVPFLIQEVRITEETLPDNLPQAGDFLKIEEVLKPGDLVQVTGTSKGKGFAGVVKRHNFRGGPRTHGQSDRERAPGSIGQTTTPGRVYKGKRMAGRMGTEQVSVKNLVVMDVNEKDKTLLIMGLVPGYVGNYLTITKIGEVKEKNFVPLHKTATPEEETPVEAAPEETAPAEQQETAAVEQAKTTEPESKGEDAVTVEEQENVATEKKEETNG